METIHGILIKWHKMFEKIYNEIFNKVKTKQYMFILISKSFSDILREYSKSFCLLK